MYRAADVALGVFGAGGKAGRVVPNKVYMAAACGTPVITRDGPGIRELFKPNAEIAVVPPEDAEALAAAIRELMQDRERLNALGRRGYSVVQRLRGSGTTAERLLDEVRALADVDAGAKTAQHSGDQSVGSRA